MLRMNPAKATADFVAAAELFVNEDAIGAERRGRYLVSLQAVLQDQQLDIAPRQFAEAHLDPADQPAFLNRVREMGLDPQVPFAKDLSLVKSGGFKMTFSHGMVLLGTPQDLRERVELPAESQTTDHVTLRDSVALLQLRGR